MQGDDIYCAEASLEVGEPLYGTAASDTDLWLVLEHEGPWGPKGLDDSGLPDAVVAQLSAFTREERRARVQLARRPDRSGLPPKLWLSRTTPGAELLWELDLASHHALTELDLPALARGTVPVEARVVHEPMFFVCVHGRRDRCCAQRGMPVYAELTRLAKSRTWMTTHLGGHRFAATLVVLPHGISYGRVVAGEMQALIAAHEKREIYDLTRVRGRTAYAPVVQAADVLVRERLGERRLDAVCFERVETAGKGERVVFCQADTGAEHAVVLDREPLLPIAQSCGAKPKAGERFVVR